MDKRIVRRGLFDTVAEHYDRARPAYPAGLISDLVDFAARDKRSRVLEIGPGTGRLSVLLAERGFSLTGLELGPKLADVARRRLSRFANAEVIVADFDKCPLPYPPFDLVVAATALHWLDPTTRMQRCADALRPDGALAIVAIRWGVRHDDDPFFEASQSCYARWDPEHDRDHRSPAVEELPETHEDLAGTRLFDDVVHHRYVCKREYTAGQYCDLLLTFSTVLALEPAARTGFLTCIADLIDSRFGGSIIRHDVYDLWLARKAA
jgi:SAM-dependent methyltransferase